MAAAARLALLAATMMEANATGARNGAGTKMKRRRKPAASGAGASSDTSSTGTLSAAGPDKAAAATRPTTLDAPPTPPQRRPPSEGGLTPVADFTMAEPEPADSDEKETTRDPSPNDHDSGAHEDIGCHNEGRYFCRSKSTPKKGQRQMTMLDAKGWADSKNSGLRYIHKYEVEHNYFRRVAGDSGAAAEENEKMRKMEDSLNGLAVRILQKYFTPDKYDCEADCVVRLPKPFEPIFEPVPWKPWWWARPVDQPQCTDQTGEKGDDADEYPWGLDRISHPDGALDPSNPLDNKYDRNCICCGLERTVVFVIDTGIQSHCEFGSRLLTSEGRSFDRNDPTDTSPADPPIQESGDTHGHGTHVAGTVGGCTVGVNQCTTLVGLRVFPANSGSTWRSWIIAAIDYVTEKALNVDGNDSLANYHKTINMSVGGGYSTAYESAINDAYDAGVTVVVAAGNSYGNACSYSPSHVENAITVGATKSDDTIPSFSNTGSCVDIFAPGHNVLSAEADHADFNMDEDCTYQDMSGTSMASPHVAGAASLAHAYGLANTPKSTWEFLKCTAFKNMVDTSTALADTTELLLRVNLIQNWRMMKGCGKLFPVTKIPFTKIPVPH